MRKPLVNPYLAIFFGVIAVSFSSLFVRLSSAPALMIATYRLLFTFLVLLPFSLVKLSDLRAMGAKRLFLAATGGLFLALHFVTWFISLNYTSVASSVVLVTTQPIFVVLGSLFFFRERIPRLALLGGGLAITGSVIIGAADFQVGLKALFGDLLALLAAIMISGYLLIGRRLRKDVPLEAFTAVTYGTSSLALIITALATQTPFTGYPPRDWLLFAALALVCTVMGHTVFSWVLRYVQASVVSVSILGEPLGAILWASIFLGEPPTLRQIIGGVVIFSGLYLFTQVSARTPLPMP
jgi:drug/metabolite transporter (DMT)-like permease